MSDRDKSRLKQYEKRRRNNKFITYFAMIASVLIVILIGTWIFSGGEDEVTESPNEQEEEEGFFLDTEEDENSEEENNENEQEIGTESSEETDENMDSDEGTEEDSGEAGNDENSSNESERENRQLEYEGVTVEYEESDDPNVLEAYTGNWPPIGTEQTGPHTTVYEVDSQDWIEIKRAVSYVTGLSEEEMSVLWIGNGGEPQKVIATVTDASHSEIFRVYLSWVDGEGWQPTRFEVLAEDDS